MKPLPDLVPCPFCGAGQTRVHENGRMWQGMGWSEPVSYSIYHWCEAEPGQPERAIERVGRDFESAVRRWNTRA